MSLGAALSEPSSAAPAMQRSRGVVRVGVRRGGAASRVHRLFQEGCAQVRFSAQGAEGCDAVLINTSGGMAGGDRLDWAVEVDEGAGCTVVTQACEKIYRARGEPARTAIRLQAGAGSRLEWLPQETILYEAAGLERRLEADLGTGARLLLTEAVILGRTAMGERVDTGRFSDRWRVRRNGRLIFADEVRLGGDIARRTARGSTLDGARAFATAALFTDRGEALADGLRAALGDAGGVSAFDDKLICRIVAADGAALRRVLIPVLILLCQGRPLPRVWTN